MGSAGHTGPTSRERAGEAVDVLERYERAFNDNDAAAMNALFADDASFVNFNGRIVIGRTALLPAQEFVFAEGGPLADVTVEYDVEYVAVLDSRAVLIHAHQRSRDHDRTTDPMAAVLTVVVERSDDHRWRIRFGQNTPVTA